MLFRSQVCLFSNIPTTPLTSVTGNTTADISWSANGNGASISYYWEVKNSGGTTIKSGNTTSTSASVTGLTTNTSYYFTVYSSNSCGASAIATSDAFTTLAIAPTNLSYSASPVVATINTTAVSASPTVTGTVVSYGISPALPTGVNFNTSSGVISGTPSVLSAQTDYTITATNTGGSTSGTFRMTVNAIAPTNLSYSASPVLATINTTAVSASPTVTGSVVSYGISPALPTGVNFNISSGVISGTPSVLSAQTDYTITATNTGGSTTGAFRLTVNAILPTLTTTAATSITATTATSGGNISSDGGATVTARGVCWGIAQNPTIANTKTTDGTGTGSFTSSIIGITAATT